MGSCDPRSLPPRGTRDLGHPFLVRGKVPLTAGLEAAELAELAGLAGR